MAEHFVSIFWTQQYKSDPPIVQSYVTILFNHTNPSIFFAVNDYNDNYSEGEARGEQLIYNQ